MCCNSALIQLGRLLRLPANQVKTSPCASLSLNCRGPSANRAGIPRGLAHSAAAGSKSPRWPAPFPESYVAAEAGSKALRHPCILFAVEKIGLRNIQGGGIRILGDSLLQDLLCLSQLSPSYGKNWPVDVGLHRARVNLDGLPKILSASSKRRRLISTSAKLM